ncbi:MAG: DUF2975 domain-containing protein [Negativicutes bacterium]|nr:DUF2975 domain-containing protein [Negativicutes bacterium]
MDWNQNKSILLSRLCIIAFAVLLAAIDFGACWLVPRLLSLSVILGSLQNSGFLFAVIYSCSIMAWILLFSLWKLLQNMKAGIVFQIDNVRYLRITSWCCFAVCAIGFASAFFYFPIILIAIAAGFVGLIVRIVKNVFEQARIMKEELDFTV